jgi:hypothetical protein
MARLVLAYALVMVATACHTETRSAATRSPTDPGTRERATIERMHQRYAAARTIEEAIVWGDLATAQAQARSLALGEDPDVPLSWRPYVARVREVAREVEASGVIVSAARHSAELASACAACHVAAAGRPTFAARPEPTGGDTVGAQMQTHAWGAARMWEGLVAPDDDRWSAGARMLVWTPITLPPSEQSRLSDNMVSVQRAMASHLEQIRADATRALTLARSDRVAIYGTMLVTCATCHALVRDVRLAAQ